MSARNLRIKTALGKKVRRIDLHGAACATKKDRLSEEAESTGA